jgi:hypothetical protein
MAAHNPALLASVVAKPRTGSIVGPDTRNDAQYRKYAAALTTSCRIKGNNDLSVKRILYEVGARHKHVADALAPEPDSIVRLDCCYDTAEVASSEFSSLAKKFSNFSSSFKVSNLAAVVERIAKGLATDSAFSAGVSASDLLAGRLLRVHGLQSYDGPAAAHDDVVFIPRLVDTVIQPDTFSVLAHAVCGEGGVVATDLVNVDPSTREPIMFDVDEAAFAKAAVSALRLLGANFAACDQGELFAFAVVRGFNHVLSVVGHTDEGGVVRDILRRGQFSVPYGGIHCGLATYTGLPLLSTSNTSTIAGYVDSILLVAAGLVAHCDPGITVNDVWFPTVLQGAARADAELESGGHQDGLDVHAQRNKRALLANFDAFSDRYCGALALMLGLPPGHTRARRAFATCASLLDSDCRHLRYASVAPYFWVEPTSLIPHDFTGYRAEVEGFGARVTRGADATVPAFERITHHRAAFNEAAAGYDVRFRSARTCAFLAHFNGHEADGLALVTPRQLDPNLIIHPGPCDNETVAARLRHAEPLSSYLWRRGQSPLCAPGEFLNLGGAMAIRVRHTIFDDDGYATLTHMPTASEFIDLAITMSVTVPVGVAPGPLTAKPLEVRRARTAGTRALAAAVEHAGLYGYGVSDDVMVAFTTPSFERRGDLSQRLPDKATESTGGPAVAVLQSGEAGAPANDRDRARAVALAATVVNAPSSGPQVAPNPAPTRGGASTHMRAADTPAPPPPPAERPNTTDARASRPAPAAVAPGDADADGGADA